MSFKTPYEKISTRKCLIHILKETNRNMFKNDYDMDFKI